MRPRWRTIIHRGETFVYEGETYLVRGGPQEGYTIHDRHTGVALVEGFDSLDQIRDYVDDCRRNGWQIGEGQS